MAGIPQPNARHLMLSRFRKGKRSVPGTYMSAAGIQTELSPNCLHKVAVHEAIYRKHVNIYRQDLEQKVDKLNKNQNILKKSIFQYRAKKRENNHKRYHPTSTQSDTSWRGGRSKQMLIIVDEHGQLSKPVPIRRQGYKRASDSLKSPSLISDGAIVLDFDSDKENTAEFTIDEVNTECRSLPSDLESEQFVKEFAGFQSTSDVSTPATTALGLPTEVESNVKARTRRKAVPTPPAFPSSRKGITSHSLDNIPSVSRATHTELKARKSKSAAGTACSVAVPLSANYQSAEVSEATSQAAQTWPMTIARQSNHRKSQSQTAAFMQLVRMKNSNSMSKNINMIDKLISGSKNKRLVYLRRISEVSDTGLSQLRSHNNGHCKFNHTDNHEDMVDNSSRPPSRHDNSPRPPSRHDNSPRPPSGHDSWPRPPSRHFKLPRIETDPEPWTENRIEEKYKRAMRKASVVAIHSPEPLSNSNELKIETVKEKLPSPKLKTRQAQRDFLLRSEHMTSSRDISRFIQDEKAVIALYGKNVTWQESLAKLRDVHYVFPSKILEEKGFSV